MKSHDVTGLDRSDVSFLYHGIDYLRVNFNNSFSDTDFDPFPLMFSGLSENSNEKNSYSFLGFDFDLFYLGFGNKKILLFKKDGLTVCELKWHLESNFKTNVIYSFTFYSTFFYVPLLSDFLLSFLVQYSKFLSVSRLDYCIDVDVPVIDVFRSSVTAFKNKDFFGDPFGDGAELQTFYYGSFRNNSRHFVRVYNKKLDTKKKEKYHIFPEYLLHDHVTRIEVQFNVASCRSFVIDIDFVIGFLSGKESFGLILRHVLFSTTGTYFGVLADYVWDNGFQKPLVIKRSNINGSPLTDVQLISRLSSAAITLRERGFPVLTYLTKKIGEDDPLSDSYYDVEF